MRSGVKHASVVTHRETQTETGFVDAGAGEGGMHQENRADKHTPCVTRTASGRPLDSTRSSACCSVMTWGGGEAREGGDVRVHTADSRCCAAEANTTL